MPLKQWLLPIMIIVMLASLMSVASATARAPELPAEDAAFGALWQRTDGVRATDAAWMWGPQDWWQTQEPYAEAPRNLRWVRYYDKARMEVTDPTLPASSLWFVSNGLLVVEMVTGQIQVGNTARTLACSIPPCGSPQPVAGDASMANRSPTYRDFAGLIQAGQANRVGQAVDQWLIHSDMAASLVIGDPTLAEQYPETVGAYYDQATQMTVPAVFWKYISRQSLEPSYVFGRPISAAYWTHTTVGGVEKDVLVQLFERRTLTYTPTNEPTWRIEMGNVGQHYYAWRYVPAGNTPWQTSNVWTLPILLYHYISANPNPRDTLRSQLSVTPQDFSAQLEYLATQGYTTITLDDLLAVQAGSAAMPDKPVLLTFDDGYADFYQNAFPLLERYQMKATIYVPSDLVGRPNYMTWEQLRQLAASPLMTIGSHSRTHPPLDTLSWEQQRDEINTSKATLEAQLGLPVQYFCYPYGRYNATTLSLIAEAGYRSATTTRPNVANASAAPLILPRIAINGHDGWAGFVAKLNTARP